MILCHNSFFNFIGAVQFLMAIKSNDIVKVKTMLENVGQLNLEFIDMKTGLSLVWLAVKNSECLSDWLLNDKASKIGRCYRIS